ncbi:MAG: small multi-drug export protein [Clostridia bacterium]|nr:small multi-drug export protein [Clostridia bacterium]
MIQFIQNLIENDFIATSVLSFVPLIELKGGIIFARGVEINAVLSFLLAYFGSTVAFFPVFFLFVPVLNLLKKIKWFSALADKIELFFKEKAERAYGKAEKGKKARSEIFYKTLGVFLFVAIPLPMTGVWTGTVIAVFLGLKFKNAILPVVAGNLTAGVIISVLAEIIIALSPNVTVAGDILNYVLYGLFILAAALFIFVIVKILRKKKNTVEEK